MPHRLISIFLLSAVALCAQAQSMYPTVSKSEQKARDEDRRPLLEAELTSELEALAQATAPQSHGEKNDIAATVHRHEENIKALKRELAATDGESGMPMRERLVARAVRPATVLADSKKTATFWDPYNRAPDDMNFSTNPRRDSHE